MKRYRAIELIISSNGVEPPASTDFGKQAAVLHRIQKGSWEGHRTKTEGFKNFLGGGAFKKVYEVPAAAGAPRDINFVMAKMVLEKLKDDGTLSDDAEIKKNMFLILREVIASMYLFGIPRMTFWVARPKAAGFGGASWIDTQTRIVLYLPRIPGKDLFVRLKEGPDDNSKIRWFCQTFALIKELHYARRFMGDLKPANIMVDDVEGANIIDLGGIERPWHLPLVRTVAYDLGSANPQAEEFFTRKWRESTGDPIPAGVLSLLRDANVAAGNAKAAIKATSEADRREYKKRDAYGFNLGLYGVYHDTYSLAVIALAMGLVNGNEHYFIPVIQSNFDPGYMRRFVENLKTHYVGDPRELERAASFHPLTGTPTFRVVPSLNSTLDPEALTSDMVAKEIAKLEQDVLTNAITRAERDSRTQALLVFEDAMVIFRAFSSIASVYQVAGGVGGKRSVDVKHQTMTALIDQLSWTIDGDQLRATLTRIFLSALVNRSIVTKEITTSFQALLTAINSSDQLRNIIRFRWMPGYTSATDPRMVRQTVLDMGALMDPEAGLTDRGAFKKGNQNERLIRLVDQAAAAGPSGPATRQQIVDAIDALATRTKTSISASPLNKVSKIRLAGQGNQAIMPSREMEDMNDETVAMTGDIAQRAFETMLSPESDASIVRYNEDIRRLYLD